MNSVQKFIRLLVAAVLVVAAFSCALDCDRPSRPRPHAVVLPNVEGGTPVFVNFYVVDPKFSDYLLVQYDVPTWTGNRDDEVVDYVASVDQVRKLGRDKFPPVRFVAIAIFHRSEHVSPETFAQSFKAAVILKADDIFAPSFDERQLVSDATVDRQPFQLDGSRQRWLVVERHAAQFSK